MTFKKSLAAWMLSLLGLSLAGCGGVSLFAVFSDDDSRPVAFQEIAASATSAIGDRSLLVIRDLTAWDTLWAEHVANQAVPLARPAVNFSQQMVIGIFLGRQINTCSGVSIQSIWQLDGPQIIEIAFREFMQANNADCLSLGNAPAVMVVVPYSPLPVTFIQVQ